ncbi:hypothetical protein DsansV1_C48g0243351 [Dioscorea sansibarensis]
MKEASVGPISVQTDLASSSCMSATTTLAPCLQKSLAVLSSMPLAPSVMSATFPSKLNMMFNSKILIFEV